MLRNIEVDLLSAWRTCCLVMGNIRGADFVKGSTDNDEHALGNPSGVWFTAELGGQGWALERIPILRHDLL